MFKENQPEKSWISQFKLSISQFRNLLISELIKNPKELLNKISKWAWPEEELN